MLFVRRPVQSSAVLCDSRTWCYWPPRLINVGCCDVVNPWGATYSPGARVSVLSPMFLLPWDVPVLVCGFSEESLVDAAAVKRRCHRCCCYWAPRCCCCCGSRRAAGWASPLSSLLLLSAVVVVAAAVWAPTLCTAAMLERGNAAMETVSQWVFDKALMKIIEQWTAVKNNWISSSIIDSEEVMFLSDWECRRHCADIWIEYL